MSTQIKFAFVSLLAVTLLGCGAARRSSETSAAETADPMFACALDADCVAIEDDSACATGVLVAVNKDHAADDGGGDGATDCSIAAADDTRVAQCDFHAHRCQLIAPTQIHCEGFIFPSHQCPTGFACNFAGRVPDVGGTCVAQSN
jgi:hypothetical protein